MNKGHFPGCIKLRGALKHSFPSPKTYLTIFSPKYLHFSKYFLFICLHNTYTKGGKGTVRVLGRARRHPVRDVLVYVFKYAQVAVTWWHTHSRY